MKTTIHLTSKNIDEITCQIGELIHQQRLTKKMKQQEVADIAGITPLTLSRIEHGLILPKMVTLTKIFNALQLNVELITEEGS